jgi:hypothetical protein
MKRILLLLASFTFGFSHAQSRQIKGIDSDDTGQRLSGVNVLVKGSRTGTQTAADGRFTLTLTSTGPVNLVFSSASFKAVTVPTDGTTEVSVKMEKDVSSLEDVVVVGYSSYGEENLPVLFLL